MTGTIYNCPNLSECLDNSPLNRREAIRLYFLNQGIKPEDIRINGRPSQDNNFLDSPCLSSSSFTYNFDSETRDRIIFGTPIAWEDAMGGVQRFHDLTREKLQQLISHGFANPADSQNFSPTIGDFFEFAQRQGNKGFEFILEGYVISPERRDYRVSIDSLFYRGICSTELIFDFQEFVNEPDELEIEPNYLRAWWD
ncbi:hypothetical protein ACP6PL_02980 [Dapis sp. BLCC M126]